MKTTTTTAAAFALWSSLALGAEAETPASTAAPAATPAQASLAAFEVRRPLLAAGIAVRVRPGSALLDRPLAGASSVGLPEGPLTLGTAVDNDEGTFWQVRQGDRAVGWVSQADLTP